MIRIVDTPQKWLPKNTLKYPPHQGLNPLIEERSFSYFSTIDINSDYLYIPIQWTEYHCSNNWGNDAAKILEIQNWVNELSNKHPDEKFFTVVQYDDGTLVSINNCKVFASSNSPKSPKSKTQEYIPIPLLSDPHPGFPKKNRMNKVGFAGRDSTHYIRKLMYDKLRWQEGYKFSVNSSDCLSEVFREIIYDSIFGLAPRGYGPTSFRMYEIMQMNSIPIYISDVFWLPFSDEIEWNKAAILVDESNIDKIPSIVDNLLETGEYQNYLEYGRMVYNKYLTWEGTLNQISKIILK